MYFHSQIVSAIETKYITYHYHHHYYCKDHSMQMNE